MSCFKLIFAIFALSLVACDDTISINCQSFGVSLLISPASPVEFWSTNCQTHNEEQVCGVHLAPWFAPWECADEIKIPGTDLTSSDLYELAIEDCEGSELDRIAFIQQELTYVQTSDELEDFQNIGSGTLWTIDESPSVTLPSSAGTHIASILGPTNTLPLEPGVSYRIDFNVTIDNDDFNVLNMVLLDSDDNVLLTEATNMTGFGPGTFDLSTGDFIAPSGVVRFGWIFGFTSFGATGPVTMIFNSYSVYRVVYSHLASFVPSDYEICEEKINLKIYNITGSPDEEIYHSDGLDIKQTHECSRLIEYHHNRNIAGIIYTEGSPELVLYLRVKSMMRIKQFPQEDLAIELTTGVDKISGSLTAQTLFEADYSPYYFHRKLMMIFEHYYVLIDTKYWKKVEKYEIIEGDRKIDLKTGEVFLTQRDFTFRLNS